MQKTKLRYADSEIVLTLCVSSMDHICGSFMPPFGNESEEAVPKKLSYLSFGSAAKPPRSRPSPSLFGAEPDESAGRAGVRGCKPSSNTHVTKIRLPFQDEDEDNFERPIKQAKAQGPMPRPSPFGAEPEEPTEPNFGSSSDGDADESEFQGVSKTVFSLGWNALVDFNRATAFKDQKNKPVEKPKRKYDNSRRSSQAAYSRRNPEFTFQKNGTDPVRLQKLFQQGTCQCACGGNLCYSNSK